ncbi:MAG: hypothetical protein HY744_31475 [Deltaproteobacteria bacterium]|nr:hypothetical protein [Deltaproteobacteria bacterium]
MPAAGETREVLLLLWFDPDSVPRLRRTAAFRPVLDALEQRPVDRDLDDTAPSAELMELEDRREVFEVLARGQPTDAEGVERAVAAGVRPDGKFVPQLVLVSGEIETPFDEVERLKATVTTVSPLVAPTDQDLKSAVDQAKELLASPDLLCPPSVADGLTRRIREAFKPEARSLPEPYVEDETGRVLLAKRHYRKRTVFGEPHLATRLHPGGDAPPVPVYLPESLAKKLPLFRRFRARLVAEARLQEDQDESHACALRALALARVAAAPGRS